MTQNEFTSSVYDCPYPSSDPRCATWTGNFNLQQTLGFDAGNEFMNYVALLIFFVVFLLGSVLLLRFKTVTVEAAKQVKPASAKTKKKALIQSDIKLEAIDKNEAPALRYSEEQQIDVRIEKLNLYLKTQRLPRLFRESKVVQWLMPTKDIHILKDVQCSFRANELNIIMVEPLRFEAQIIWLTKLTKGT